MRKFVAPFLLATSLYSTASQGQERAKDIVDSLLTPDAKSCVYDALRESVKAPNSDLPINWSETTNSKGKYSIRMSVVSDTVLEPNSELAYYFAEAGIQANDRDGVRLVGSSVGISDPLKDKTYGALSTLGMTASFANDRSKAYADHTEAAQVKLHHQVWRCLYQAEYSGDYSTQRLEPIPPGQ